MTLLLKVWSLICLMSIQKTDHHLNKFKKHKFFKDFKWSKVRNGEYTPFFIPKLDNNFDTKYFLNSNKKQKAFYISNNYETEDSNNFKVPDNKFNKNVTQEMKAVMHNEANEPRCKPLGDFRLIKINNMLKDF